MKPNFFAHPYLRSTYVSPRTKVVEINTNNLLCQQSLRVITGARTEEFEYDGIYFDE